MVAAKPLLFTETDHRDRPQRRHATGFLIAIIPIFRLAALKSWGGRRKYLHEPR